MYNFNLFIEENADSEDEREILKFGFERIKLLIISTIIVIITGYILHEPIKILIFIICLIPLRQNAGGYHMKNKWACALISYSCLLACMLIIINISLDIYIATVFIVICTILICYFSPVGNANHLLDEIEKKVYGRRARVTCIIEGIAFFVLLFNNLNEWCILIVLSDVVTSILLIIGVMQEKLKKGEENVQNSNL